MTRREPIRDPDGDRIEAQERTDRQLERADSPLTHLDVNPIERCRECGHPKREIAPSHWACPCDWSAAA